MTIDANTTLGELVNRLPAAAAVLERLQLDYCCGGSRPLAEAAATAGVDVGAVVAELAALNGTPDGEGHDWTSYGMREMVDHIESTHHRWLRAALDRLDAQAAKVEGVHASRHPELSEVRSLVTELRMDLEPHMMKEERVLFPIIRQLATMSSGLPTFHCGSVRNPIGVMLFEHERTGELLARLRTVTGGYEVPADACESYRALYQGLVELEADTHLHIHKENNVLFPAVVAAEANLTAGRPSGRFEP